MKSKIVWCNRGWQPLYFGFCPDKAAWDAEMKRLKCSEPYPESDARMSVFQTKEKRLAIVTIRRMKKRKPEEIVGLVAHECVHIWQEVQEMMQEPGKPGIEIEAYSVQAIVQEMLWAMKESGAFALK